MTSKNKSPDIIPDVVQSCIDKLKELANNDINEHGFSIYFRGDNDYVLFTDHGSGLLTVSSFVKCDNINPEYIPYLVQPTSVWLMHTHPFQDNPLPSSMDIDTSERFRNYYNCPVYCCVIGRKGLKWY